MSDLIEKYREEIRSANFKRLTDEEALAMQQRYMAAHQASIEQGKLPPTELVALFSLFVQEKVPNNVSDEYVKRYISEGMTEAV